MSRFNLALAALLAPVAFAIPQSPAYGGYGGYGHGHGHAHHSHGPRPSGISGGPSASGIGNSPTGVSSAPYGFGNSTIIGPTGTGSAIVIHSTVTVIPQPISTPINTQAHDNPGTISAGTSDLGNSPTGLSSAGGDECGPATVTVTSANTVTVTVPAAPISSPEESAPVSAPVPATPSAPYPAGNSTTGFGSTGTVGTVVPTAPGLPILSGLPSSSPIAESNTANSPIGGTSVPVASPAAPHTYKQESMPVVSHPVAPIVESTPTSSATSVPAGAFYTHASASSNGADQETTASSSAYVAPSTPIPSPSSSPSISGGDVVPRGLVYNTAALTSLFEGPKIGWCYNWDSQPGGDIPSSFNFVPMLWSTNSYHLPNWKSNADSAISKGATHILGFNEPDLPAQANMYPQDAVDAWHNLEQFGDKVKIGSPAVCNGPRGDNPIPQGLAWLSEFMEKCSSCQVDFLAIHWYGLATDDGVQNLKDHIGKAQAVAKGKPIWLTEFQPSGSTEQQAEFMSKMLPWLDDASNGVERYAYYQVDGVLSSGNSKTTLGNDYMS